jgi:hypothetical protein
MNPGALVDMIDAHGALGLACVVIGALGWAVVYLYRARDKDRDETIRWMLNYTDKQLEDGARMTAALVALKESISLAVSTRGGR